MMKKTCFCIAVIFLLFFSSCTAPSKKPGLNPQNEAKDPVELSLWLYPVGGWGNRSTVSSLLTSFNRDHPEIRIVIETVDYDTGDQKIEEAIKAGNAPDLVLEGPERLVANWGARGLMADLSDLWKNEESDEIYETVKTACKDSFGRYLVYPLCMTTHCMAINRDLFEASGAWQYIDETTHTWSTEDFIHAVETLYNYGIENVAAVYCKGQGGDQGTRALVNNLFSGTFTNPEHTSYTVESEENIRALELLKDLEGISFDPTLTGTDEITKFCNKELAMAFCWNVFMEINQVIKNPNLDFDIFPMAFPTNNKNVELQGGIWGLGIFDHGDEKRLEGAKTLIRYLTADEKNYERAVLTSTYWPVKDLPELYVNDKLMNEYSVFQQYLGDYYQVTRGWSEARTAWWEMLQRIGAGEEVPKAVKQFSEKVNANGNS